LFQDVESFLVLRERLREIVGGIHATPLGELRFVAVDDTGGFDAGIERLKAIPDVTVVDAPFNLGHQRAIVYGLRKMGPSMEDLDFVVTLDADGEDRPEDLPRLLAPLLEDPSDTRRIAVAHRTRRRTSLSFKFLYFFFRIMFRLLTGTSVRSGNFAAYRGWLAKRVLVHPNFDLSYSSALLSLGLPIRFVPCQRGERYAGRSRMGVPKLFLHGLRMLMPFTDRIAIRALVLASATFAIGAAAAAVVIGIRIFTNEAIPGWATYTLLGILILSFVALGSFITVFTAFSQSRSVSLANLEKVDDGSTGSASPRSD
jgi:hypothetical protein